MPLQDAARSACISRTYLRSWRCFPKLIFSKETLGLKQNAYGKSDIERYFTRRVDSIMKNYSDAGVKTLKFVLHDFYKWKTCHLDSWLQIAIAPRIEEVTLLLPTGYWIREDELGCLMSSSFALEELELGCCIKISMQHLLYLLLTIIKHMRIQPGIQPSCGTIPVQMPISLTKTQAPTCLLSIKLA